MAFCEIPNELPVQLPEEGDGLFYCPVKLSKRKKIGYADPSFVMCDHLEECKALHASVFNHRTSKNNTNYRAHPDRAASDARIDGVPVVNTRKWYPPDYALFLAKKQKDDGG